MKDERMGGRDFQDDPPDDAEEARWSDERAADHYDRIVRAVHRGRIAPCQDCGRFVSRRALACPACGALNTTKALRIAFYLAAAAALSWLLLPPTP